MTDIRRHLTPQLRRTRKPSRLLLLDLAGGANRLGASCLAQAFDRQGGAPPDLDAPEQLAAFFAAVQDLGRRGLILAYHDRSDGGLFATAAEMMFAGHLGVSLEVAGGDEAVLAQLFSEELGAVLQVEENRLGEVRELLAGHGLAAAGIGRTETDERLTIRRGGEVLFSRSRIELQRIWSETSWRLQSLRDNPKTARQEYDRILDADDPGLNAALTFDPAEDITAPFIGGARPRVAVLREQGVNSHLEMAAAFIRAGFDAVDVHMSDILTGDDPLSACQGLVACGGFSFGDVLGAGGGWARSILHNARAREAFERFFARGDSFALGVCNGCQMMALLRGIIPGSEQWPRFYQNESEQFEARLSLVEVAQSPSIFFSGMEGSRLPIATSHGEGRAVFPTDAARDAAEPLVALRYVDNYGRVADTYPANPNGSADGICALASDDGRVTVIMPHPERVVRTAQNSWHPEEWGDDGPWLRLFRNARVAVG